MMIPFTTATILALAGGYLLGSIPFGLLFTRMAGLGDIRDIGSGNIGATNVLRTGNKKLAALTLIADMGKGAAAVVIGSVLLGPSVAVIAGLAAFVGHLFPVWLKFKGGKGVATFLGVMLALAPDLGFAVAACWLLMAFTLRYSSLAALVAAALAPVFAGLVVRMDRADVTLIALMTLLIYFKHEGNIRRLMLGQEPKIGQKTTATAAPTPDA